MTSGQAKALLLSVAASFILGHSESSLGPISVGDHTFIQPGQWVYVFGSGFETSNTEHDDPLWLEFSWNEEEPAFPARCVIYTDEQIGCAAPFNVASTNATLHVVTASGETSPNAINITMGQLDQPPKITGLTYRSGGYGCWNYLDTEQAMVEREDKSPQTWVTLRSADDPTNELWKVPRVVVYNDKSVGFAMPSQDDLPSGNIRLLFALDTKYGNDTNPQVFTVVDFDAQGGFCNRSSGAADEDPADNDKNASDTLDLLGMNGNSRPTSNARFGVSRIVAVSIALAISEAMLLELL